MLPHVLFVDDDRIVRHMIAHHCRPYEGQFRLLLAPDGRRALELLQSESISLVVTDIQMPVMDGLELMARLSETWPDIPVVIQTAYGSAENRRAGLLGGAVEFIEKPIDGAVLAKRIAEILREQRDGGPYGSIPLDLFALLLEQEKRTGTLRVNHRAGERSGALFFRNGRLVDARFQNLRGEAAAREILVWHDTSFSLQASCPVQEERIPGGLKTVLG